MTLRYTLVKYALKSYICSTLSHSAVVSQSTTNTQHIYELTNPLF
ncbi:hypothetical protein SAMN05421780_104250 [Flexibacter flexilis DSM 6793]|uniref:Uncharacterized protein n=1 Tax=Flexibacter flexilis DSM 6793 TaxID=927664 RepID=A0A1I1I858_9BACT|nr:hypothetical protein SAMN05421780_104250 [Flexibacter flexilis DSM 6793]